MRFEVEQKFPLADAAAIEHRLEALGAKFGEPVEQIDRYLKHPARDFGMTDEALRIRRTPGWRFITYKGPKVDPTTKTAPRNRTALGRRSASRQVGRTVRSLGLQARGGSAEAPPRGKARLAGDRNRRCARRSSAARFVSGTGNRRRGVRGAGCADRIAALARELELGSGERRSYLELLIGKQHPPSAVG